MLSLIWRQFGDVLWVFFDHRYLSLIIIPPYDSRHNSKQYLTVSEGRRPARRHVAYRGSEQKPERARGSHSCRALIFKQRPANWPTEHLQLEPLVVSEPNIFQLLKLSCPFNRSWLVWWGTRKLSKLSMFARAHTTLRHSSSCARKSVTSSSAKTIVLASTHYHLWHSYCEHHHFHTTSTIRNMRTMPVARVLYNFSWTPKML